MSAPKPPTANLGFPKRWLVFIGIKLGLLAAIGYLALHWKGLV